MGRHQQFLKLVTIFVILCLLAQDVAAAWPQPTNDQRQPFDYAQGKQTTDKAETLGTADELLRDLGRFGTIDEKFEGTNGKHITFILDAHDSLDAQKNIARIIQQATASGQVQTVFEEGYEGELNTDEWFGDIQDSQVKRKVSYYYLDQLKIGAAEFAHINRQSQLGQSADWKLIGADDKQAYLENVRAFGDSKKVREQILRDTQAIQRELKALGNKQFSPETQKWIVDYQRFHEHTLPLLDYLSRWLSLVSPDICPLLNRILSAAQDAEIARNIQKTRPADFLNEIEKFQTALEARFFSEPQAYELWQATRAMSLVDRLAELKISTHELNQLKQNLENFRTENLAPLLARAKKNPVVISKRWESLIESALKFYALAHQRDQAVEKALDAWSDEKHSAILVFGGFHREGITEILRRNGFSYTVVIPKIAELSKRHQALYREVMSAPVRGSGLVTRAVQAARPMSGFFEPGFAAEVRRVASLAEKHTGNLDSFALLAARGIVGGNLSRPSGSPNTRRLLSSVRSESRQSKKANNAIPKEEEEQRARQLLSRLEAYLPQLEKWIGEKKLSVRSARAQNKMAVEIAALLNAYVTDYVSKNKPNESVNIFRDGLGKALQIWDMETHVFTKGNKETGLPEDIRGDLVRVSDFIKTMRLHLDAGRWQALPDYYDGNRLHLVKIKNPVDRPKQKSETRNKIVSTKNWSDAAKTGLTVLQKLNLPEDPIVHSVGPALSYWELEPHLVDQKESRIPWERLITLLRPKAKIKMYEPNKAIQPILLGVVKRLGLSGVIQVLGLSKAQYENARGKADVIIIQSVFSSDVISEDTRNLILDRALTNLKDGGHLITAYYHGRSKVTYQDGDPEEERRRHASIMGGLVFADGIHADVVARGEDGAHLWQIWQINKRSETRDLATPDKESVQRVFDKVTENSPLSAEDLEVAIRQVIAESRAWLIGRIKNAMSAGELKKIEEEAAAKNIAANELLLSGKNCAGQCGYSSSDVMNRLYSILGDKALIRRIQAHNEFGVRQRQKHLFALVGSLDRSKNFLIDLTFAQFLDSDSPAVYLIGRELKNRDAERGGKALDSLLRHGYVDLTQHKYFLTDYAYSFISGSEDDEAHYPAQFSPADLMSIEPNVISRPLSDFLMMNVSFEAALERARHERAFELVFLGVERTARLRQMFLKYVARSEARGFFTKAWNLASSRDARLKVAQDWLEKGLIDLEERKEITKDEAQSLLLAARENSDVLVLLEILGIHLILKVTPHPGAFGTTAAMTGLATGQWWLVPLYFLTGIFRGIATFTLIRKTNLSNKWFLILGAVVPVAGNFSVPTYMLRQPELRQIGKAMMAVAKLRLKQKVRIMSPHDKRSEMRATEFSREKAEELRALAQDIASEKKAGAQEIAERYLNDSKKYFVTPGTNDWLLGYLHRGSLPQMADLAQEHVVYTMSIANTILRAHAIPYIPIYGEEHTYAQNYFYIFEAEKEGVKEILGHALVANLTPSGRADKKIWNIGLQIFDKWRGEALGDKWSISASSLRDFLVASIVKDHEPRAITVDALYSVTQSEDIWKSGVRTAAFWLKGGFYPLNLFDWSEQAQKKLQTAEPLAAQDLKPWNELIQNGRESRNAYWVLPFLTEAAEINSIYGDLPRDLGYRSEIRTITKTFNYGNKPEERVVAELESFIDQDENEEAFRFRIYDAARHNGREFIFSRKIRVSALASLAAMDYLFEWLPILAAGGVDPKISLSWKILASSAGHDGFQLDSSRYFVLHPALADKVRKLQAEAGNALSVSFPDIIPGIDTEPYVIHAAKLFRTGEMAEPQKAIQLDVSIDGQVQVRSEARDQLAIKNFFFGLGQREMNGFENDVRAFFPSQVLEKFNHDDEKPLAVVSRYDQTGEYKIMVGSVDRGTNIYLGNAHSPRTAQIAFKALDEKTLFLKHGWLPFYEEAIHAPEFQYLERYGWMTFAHWLRDYFIPFAQDMGFKKIWMVRNPKSRRALSEEAMRSLGFQKQQRKALWTLDLNELPAILKRSESRILDYEKVSDMELTDSVRQAWFAKYKLGMVEHALEIIDFSGNTRDARKDVGAQAYGFSLPGDYKGIFVAFPFAQMEGERDNGYFALFDQQGEIVCEGLYSAAVISGSKRKILTLRFQVLPEYRSQGYGRVTTEAIRYFADQLDSEMQLFFHFNSDEINNLALRKSLTGLGFQEIPQVPHMMQLPRLASFRSEMRADFFNPANYRSRPISEEQAQIWRELFPLEVRRHVVFEQDGYPEPDRIPVYFKPQREASDPKPGQIALYPFYEKMMAEFGSNLFSIQKLDDESILIGHGYFPEPEKWLPGYQPRQAMMFSFWIEKNLLPTARRLGIKNLWIKQNISGDSTSHLEKTGFEKTDIEGLWFRTVTGRSEARQFNAEWNEDALTQIEAANPGARAKILKKSRRSEARSALEIFDKTADSLLAYPKTLLHSRGLEPYLDVFDREHYDWDETHQHWASKDFHPTITGAKRLILGSWEDIQRASPYEHARMKNFVAIRLKTEQGPRSFYAFDDHGWSLQAYAEAHWRREIPAFGNTQIFIDKHGDDRRVHGGQYYAERFLAMLRQDAGTNNNIEFDMGGFNNTLWASGFIPKENHLRYHARMGWLKEALTGFPSNQAVLLNVDTDATEFIVGEWKNEMPLGLGEEDFESLAVDLTNLRDQYSLTPLTAHFTTTHFENENLADFSLHSNRIQYGDTELARFLARVAPFIYFVKDQPVELRDQAIAQAAQEHAAQWEQDFGAKFNRSEARSAPDDRSAQVRPVPLTETEKTFLMESIQFGGMKRADGGKVWLFGEQESELPFAAGAGYLEFSPQVPRDWFANKNVLVAPGYGNLPFLIRQLGAEHVTAIDKDELTILWQKARYWMSASNLRQMLLNVFDTTLRAKIYWHGLIVDALSLKPRQDDEQAGMDFLTADLARPLTMGRKYDLIVMPYVFAVQNGLENEAVWNGVLANIESVLNPEGRILIMPAKFDMSLFPDSPRKQVMEDFSDWLESLKNRGYSVEASEAYPHYSMIPMHALAASFVTIQRSRSEMRDPQKAAEDIFNNFFLDPISRKKFLTTHLTIRTIGEDRGMEPKDIGLWLLEWDFARALVLKQFVINLGGAQTVLPERLESALDLDSVYSQVMELVNHADYRRILDFLGSDEAPIDFGRKVDEVISDVKLGVEQVETSAGTQELIRRIQSDANDYKRYFDYMTGIVGKENFWKFDLEMERMEWVDVSMRSEARKRADWNDEIGLWSSPQVIERLAQFVLDPLRISLWRLKASAWRIPESDVNVVRDEVLRQSLGWPRAAVFQHEDFSALSFLHLQWSYLKARSALMDDPDRFAVYPLWDELESLSKKIRESRIYTYETIRTAARYSGIWGHGTASSVLREAKSDYQRWRFRMVHDHDLEDEWAMLNIMIEGKINEGEGSPFAGMELGGDTPDSWGPFWILTRDFQYFYKFHPSGREDHWAYLVPNQAAINFFERGLELAVSRKLMTEEERQDVRSKLVTYDEFNALEERLWNIRDQKISITEAVAQIGVTRSVRSEARSAKQEILYLISDAEIQSQLIWWLPIVKAYWFFRGHRMKIIRNATSDDLKQAVQDNRIRKLAVVGHGSWNSWKANDKNVTEDELDSWMKGETQKKDLFITYTCCADEARDGIYIPADKFGWSATEEPYYNVRGAVGVTIASFFFDAMELYTVDDLLNRDSWRVRFFNSAWPWTMYGGLLIFLDIEIWTVLLTYLQIFFGNPSSLGEAFLYAGTTALGLRLVFGIRAPFFWKWKKAKQWLEDKISVRNRYIRKMESVYQEANGMLSSLTAREQLLDEMTAMWNEKLDEIAQLMAATQDKENARFIALQENIAAAKQRSIQARLTRDESAWQDKAKKIVRLAKIIYESRETASKDDLNEILAERNKLRGLKKVTDKDMQREFDLLVALIPTGERMIQELFELNGVKGNAFSDEISPELSRVVKAWKQSRSEARLDELLDKNRRTNSEWSEMIALIKKTMPTDTVPTVAAIAGAPAAQGKIRAQTLVVAVNNAGGDYSAFGLSAQEKNSIAEKETKIKAAVQALTAEKKIPSPEAVLTHLQKPKHFFKGLDEGALRKLGLVFPEKEKTADEKYMPILEALAAGGKKFETVREIAVAAAGVPESYVKELGAPKLATMGLLVGGTNPYEKLSQRFQDDRAAKIEANSGKGKKFKTIAELAESTGIPATTLAHYTDEQLEELGYIPRPVKIERAVKALLVEKPEQVISYEVLAQKVTEMDLEELKPEQLREWNLYQKPPFTAQPGWRKRFEPIMKAVEALGASDSELDLFFNNSLGAQTVWIWQIEYFVAKAADILKQNPYFRSKWNEQTEKDFTAAVMRAHTVTEPEKSELQQISAKDAALKWLVATGGAETLKPVGPVSTIQISLEGFSESGQTLYEKYEYEKTNGLSAEMLVEQIGFSDQPGAKRRLTDIKQVLIDGIDQGRSWHKIGLSSRTSALVVRHKNYQRPQASLAESKTSLNVEKISAPRKELKTKPSPSLAMGRRDARYWTIAMLSAAQNLAVDKFFDAAEQAIQAMSQEGVRKNYLESFVRVFDKHARQMDLLSQAPEDQETFQRYEAILKSMGELQASARSESRASSNDTVDRVQLAKNEKRYVQIVKTALKRVKPGQTGELAEIESGLSAEEDARLDRELKQLAVYFAQAGDSEKAAVMFWLIKDDALAASLADETKALESLGNQREEMIRATSHPSTSLRTGEPRTTNSHTQAGSGTKSRILISRAELGSMSEENFKAFYKFFYQNQELKLSVYGSGSKNPEEETRVGLLEAVPSAKTGRVSFFLDQSAAAQGGEAIEFSSEPGTKTVRGKKIAAADIRTVEGMASGFLAAMGMEYTEEQGFVRVTSGVEISRFFEFLSWQVFAAAA